MLCPIVTIHIDTDLLTVKQIPKQYAWISCHLCWSYPVNKCKRRLIEHISNLWKRTTTVQKIVSRKTIDDVTQSQLSFSNQRPIGIMISENSTPELGSQLQFPFMLAMYGWPQVETLSSWIWWLATPCCRDANPKLHNTSPIRGRSHPLFAKHFFAMFVNVLKHPGSIFPQRNTSTTNPNVPD